MNQSASMRLNLGQQILDAAEGDVICVRGVDETRTITIKIEPTDKELKGRPQDFVPYVIIYDELEAEVIKRKP